MDDICKTAINRFQAYLVRRQFSPHTVASYTLDLRLFFAEIALPLARVSFHEVDQFVERQQQHSRAYVSNRSGRGSGHDRAIESCGRLLVARGERRDQQ